MISRRVMQRIRVVGNSGSGKTTFARRLATHLNLPYRELDEVFWGPNWRRRDLSEAKTDLQDWLTTAGTDGWIIDGNWNNRIGDLLAAADTIIWLDYPRRTIMYRVIRRTISRIVTGQEIWHGNRERPRNLFKWNPEDNIIRWAWTEHNNYRHRYQQLAERDRRVIRIPNPATARKLIAIAARHVDRDYPPFGSSSLPVAA